MKIIHVDAIVFPPSTCCTAYDNACCAAALPDIETLITKNDWDFDNTKDKLPKHYMWCITAYIDIELFLNITSILAKFMYLGFALWLFWYFIVSDLVNQGQGKERILCNISKYKDCES